MNDDLKAFDPLQKGKYVYIEFVPPGQDGKFLYCKIADVSINEEEKEAVITAGMSIVMRQIVFGDNRTITIPLNMMHSNVKVYDSIEAGLEDSLPQNTGTYLAAITKNIER